MTQQEIIDSLIAGNQKFVSEKAEGKLRDKARITELTNGQNPDTIVLSCADSRVVPEIAFDKGLGELFVVRVAGNIANTDSIASIEYAVAHLGSQVIVVLGHESCGAVTAAVNGGDNGYNLNHLLCQITPAIEATDSPDVNEVVKTNAKLNASELVERSKIIADAVNSGKVKIVSAYYQLHNGEVKFL
ncbi:MULTISPECIES: carbonic anhydrase [unclassified Flammeovirga]|uniref:carbonic anhydrase n=1 Tax=unclassified Flammeovirga TaxID=2637820 RepID=UPI0005C4A658|nr:MULTISPECIES: carbonic anhydrase [unclassified Flammeovirga]MBD0402269.1 carbonic anhydrase [Flammeovirga sp. EKP202]